MSRRHAVRMGGLPGAEELLEVVAEPPPDRLLDGCAICPLAAHHLERAREPAHERVALALFVRHRGHVGEPRLDAVQPTPVRAAEGADLARAARWLRREVVS